MADSTPEEKLLNLIKKDQSNSKLGKDLKIFTNINIILAGIIGIVAIIFLSDVFIFKNKPAQKLAEEMDIKTAQIQPVSAEKIKEEAPVEQVMPEKDMGTESISKEAIAANYNLLGIIRGDNDQVIIEDKTLKKNFFLYKGDSLGESLKVYDIKESAVILDYKGDKIELKI